MVKQVKTRQNGGFMGLSHQAWSQLINTKDADESGNQRRRLESFSLLRQVGLRDLFSDLFLFVFAAQ